ncbi:MAG: DUF448 domain-containing protein [Myxococcales bacterium]|nr:DUF448 domain-containing protein [Myxococcales bacterium]
MHQPRRTCIVCRQTSDKTALLRVARARAAAAEIRPYAGFAVGRLAPGRGAYVHGSAACVDRLDARHLIAASTSSRQSAGRASVAQQLGGSTLIELRTALKALAHQSLSSPLQSGSTATN